MTLDLATTTSLAKDSRQYMAFTTKYGKNEFLTVPFGIHVAPGQFALMINETLKALDLCLAYLDDIIIYSKTEQHIDHTREIFYQLWTANVKQKMTKCDLFKSQIHYLGHTLSQDGI